MRAGVASKKKKGWRDKKPRALTFNLHKRKRSRRSRRRLPTQKGGFQNGGKKKKKSGKRKKEEKKRKTEKRKKESHKSEAVFLLSLTPSFHTHLFPFCFPAITPKEKNWDWVKNLKNIQTFLFQNWIPAALKRRRSFSIPQCLIKEPGRCRAQIGAINNFCLHPTLSQHKLFFSPAQKKKKRQHLGWA